MSGYIYIYIYTLPVVKGFGYIYIYIPKTLYHRQDVRQSQFLRGVQLVLIQNFPSTRLVALLKNPFYSNTYS